MANNNDGQIVLGLDIPKTVSQINADISKLQDKLNQVKATGALDTSETVKQINAQITALQSQLKTIEIKTNIDPKALQSVQKAEKQVANSQEQAYKNAQKELKKLYDLRIEYAKIDNPNNNQKYLYENAIKEQEKVWRKAYANTSEPENWNVQKRLELQRQEVAMQEKLENAYDKTFVAKKKVDEIQHSLNVKDYDVQLKSFETALRKAGFEGTELENKLNGIKTALNNLRTSATGDNIIPDTVVENARLLDVEIEKISNDIKLIKLDDSLVADDIRVSDTITKLNEQLRKNTKYSNEAKEKIEAWIGELKKGNVAVSRLKEINSETKALHHQMANLGKIGKSFFETFSSGVTKFIGWAISSVSVMDVWNTIKQGVDELKELDSILTEISKTSELTKSQLKELGNIAFESASKYGESASTYLISIQEMYRAGFDNAKEMAELVTLAKKAGDMETSSSVDYVTATSAAYDYEGSIKDLTRVLDGQNYITNNAAISMQDMADAISEAASIASQYGVEVNELSALIAVAVSKTRESGSEVGTALKSLFVNLQDTTSKPIREAFDAVEISMTKIVNGAEQLKTPIELIKELSVVFNQLPEGDIKRTNILNDIAGKYHANTFAAILSDLDSYNDMLELYSQGMGSAAIEAEKSANNWEGATKRISNSTNDLIQNFVQSDFIIGVLNAVNELIVGVDKLTESFGALGTIGIGAGLFAGIKNVGTVQ